MKTLSVTLNQDYKSFKNGFNVTLEGDLIILSGVNGSGKSQLIDIIAQMKSYGGKESISAVVKLNENQINRDDILRRSFKDNLSVPEITHDGHGTVAQHKTNAWNAYREGRLDFNDKRLWGFKSAVRRAKSILIDKFGEEKFNNKITQDEFNRALPTDFVWKPDDVFTNTIGDLFFNYAADVYDERAKAGDTEHKFDPETLPEPPWKQLNGLFLELGFEYRFKENFSVGKSFQMNELPRLFQIKGDGAINENEPRSLADLSDGEKSIISLSFASLSGVKTEEKKVLLLDEFDANFNPSLTEIFYKILDRYFISKGIVVIVATHSPTTISLAPDTASFYEVFKPNAVSSHRIMPVQKDAYEELKVANKAFYKKVSNQKNRIDELEGEIQKLNQLKSITKPALIVEDKYDQIYKIAWLKLNEVEYENTSVDINKKFFEKAGFEIYGFESAGSVSGLLRVKNSAFYSDKKIIGLYDYDEEGSENFYHLKNDNGMWSKEIEGSLSEGFYKKRKDHDCFFALLLPVPALLENTVSDIKSGKFQSFVEIENLLPEHFLKGDDFCVEDKVLNCQYLKIKDDKKSVLWKKLHGLSKADFENFVPLFKRVEEFFGVVKGVGEEIKKFGKENE